MSVSANGYEVLDSDVTGPQPRLRDWRMPGVGRNILLRDGSCGFLLVHIAMWFDTEIEDIGIGSYDDHGWGLRKIGGTDVWSNHSSGTAIDLNALQHPQGVATSKTFSDKEITRIHNRLKMYEGCIKWGGDYRTTPDAMHFEIDKPLALVVEKAVELVATPRGRRICNQNPGVKALIVS